jgi:hypothetical protein
MDDKDRKDRVIFLMQRFNQLGRLLPSEDDVRDGEGHAEAKLIIREMAKVEAEVNALLVKKGGPRLPLVLAKKRGEGIT